MDISEEEADTMSMYEQREESNDESCDVDSEHSTEEGDGGENENCSSEQDYSGEEDSEHNIEVEDGAEDGDHISEDDSVHNTEDGENLDNPEEEGIIIDGLVDILKIDMKNILTTDVSRYDFCDLDVAYLFYSWYARMNGFSVRKSNVVRNNKGEKLQQTFVCSNAGFREDRGLTIDSRKRQGRRETRCGCEAKFRVHVDISSGRFYVTLFIDEHNHDLVEDMYCPLLPAHRKMTEANVLQIENFSKVGIRPSLMYGAFANASGGYDKIGFKRKDIYNQVRRQKRKQISDASAAIKFLKELESKDPMMFVRFTKDGERRLQRLFWADGESQMNYKVFGDVVAFDATYRKNKYLCPLVIFSGVNHHNQTIVFATALVSNETEETYVWLLECFMEVMGGNAPSSVITDGDLSMKNAIKTVFPEAYHRLCAWHLLRNATTNVKIPDFNSYLKRCMLGDYDVGKFEEIWDEMVTKFGLEDNDWVQDLYQKRKMWATALIKGKFFGGIRTTSRCEALHCHIGKFIHSRISLTDFVKQYHRCLTYFRFREVEADFESNYGEVVLQTNLRSIERSASKKFTNAIFYLFRDVLKKSSLTRVLECHEMATYSIYSVSKYRGYGTVWHVSFCPSPIEFRCSCLKMESMGYPCEHIVTVMGFLDFNELPDCLVLSRWSKKAKEAIRGSYTNGSFYWDSQLVAKQANLHFLCREIVEVAYRDDEDYNHLVDMLTCEINKLKLKHRSVGGWENVDIGSVEEVIYDPPIVRTKGCGPSSVSGTARTRRVHKCRICGEGGHNRRCCPTLRDNGGSDEDTYEDIYNASMLQDNEHVDTSLPTSIGAIGEE